MRLSNLLIFIIMLCISSLAYAYEEKYEYEESINLENVLDQEAENYNKDKDNQNFLPMIEESLNDTSHNFKEFKYTRIQLLNKITGKYYNKDVENGTETAFGTLKIKVYKCVLIPKTYTNEHAALIEINDYHNEEEHRVFYGWMFANNLSISVLEHALYDVLLKSCIIK